MAYWALSALPMLLHYSAYTVYNVMSSATLSQPSVTAHRANPNPHHPSCMWMDGCLLYHTQMCFKTFLKIASIREKRLMALVIAVSSYTQAYSVSKFRITRHAMRFQDYTDILFADPAAYSIPVIQVIQ